MLLPPSIYVSERGSPDILTSFNGSCFQPEKAKETCLLLFDVGWVGSSQFHIHALLMPGGFFGIAVQSSQGKIFLGLGSPTKSVHAHMYLLVLGAWFTFGIRAKYG